MKCPHEKYGSANYEQIGRVLYKFTDDGLASTQQFARRLLVNILLANGDAHLKNWSLLYNDQITPTLAPAYDILTTSVYMENETKFALDPGKTKKWLNVSTTNFQSWAEKSGIPWRTIKPHLGDTMEKARSLWPDTLKELPMNDGHKEKLKAHWQNFQAEFQIESIKSAG